MKIHEYQARELFLEYSIPAADAIIADSPKDAGDAGEKIGFPVAVKAQVLVGGRGKAGGVKIAHSRKEAVEAAEQILGLTIKSVPVTKVMIARAVSIEKEFYCSLVLDRGMKQIVCMFSSAGGVEIEELAKKEPEKIHKLPLDPFKGAEEHTLQKFFDNIVEENLADQCTDIVMKLYRLFIEKGCSLTEINPLALTGEGVLLALDAKINFDDNAVPFHSELEKFRNPEELNEEEKTAQAAGLHFISLDGDIGCIVNGAGLAMATMDMIKLYGSRPANFLDVGGSSSPEKVLTALKVILRIPKVKGILFNIFGGITRCDDIAEGILLAQKQLTIDIPIVIRLIGTNDQKGREMLKEAGIFAVENLDDAVKKIIAASKGEG